MNERSVVTIDNRDNNSVEGKSKSRQQTRDKTNVFKVEDARFVNWLPAVPLSAGTAWPPF